MSKGQAPKMRGTICNVPINVADICNVLPRGMDNNGIVRISLKKKKKTALSLVFILSPFVQTLFEIYYYLLFDLNNIPRCWINTINNNDDNDVVQNETENTDNEEIHFVNEESIEVVQNGLLEEEDINPLDNFRESASETTYVPELAFDIVDNSNIVIAPGEDREPVPIICDENCEMLAFPDLFPNGKFGYTYDRDIKFSPCKYSNQRLLNYSQKFASDPDYIFYAQSVTQHINLNNSINIAMKKIRTEALTAGQLSCNFKET